VSVKFTEKAERILLVAGNEARRRSHEYIGTEHLLYAVLTHREGPALQALIRVDVDPEELQRAAVEALERVGSSKSVEAIPFTPHAKRCLELASDEAVRLGQCYIGIEHLMVGLLQEDEGCAARLFAECAVPIDRVLEELKAMLGGGPEEEGKDSPKFGAGTAGRPKLAILESFGMDLTELASQNKLGPVIGRQAEIQRLIQILSRKTKNNPVVLGEPGVGKTAIIEGLAQRIADRDVPEVLLQKRMISLDLAAVLAGTKYRGEFEKRLKGIIKEVIDSKNVILFIDEIHTMMGAGASESSLDASNILKPPLSRGEIQCIGATTLDEFRKHIEKDGAMERRFQPIIIDPPSKEEAVAILTGLRDGFEAHHRIRITDDALRAAVELSSRYISGRFLPDKAIDVLDEACSRERLSRSTKPPDVTQLESDIERLEREKDEAVHSQDFEMAAGLRDKMEKAKRRREEILLRWKKSSKEIDGKVDSVSISETVALMTGIPVANLKEGEADRLLHMEDFLGGTVVSQETAIKAVSNAIRRSRAGLKDPERPLGSFIFIGPSGVGKTLLAKALAKFLFGSEESLIAIDMSEYMERHNLSRLIGSPPGYVGYEEGGQLTEKIRRKPYSVVLFDEVEKAHPDLTNMLLQIMEEGRLTDSFGRKIDFKNTILIMTSNLGARAVVENSGLGFRAGGEEVTRSRRSRQLREELENHFRPEFLNRIDAVVNFEPLSPEAIRRIFELEAAKVVGRIASRGIGLDFQPDCIEFLISNGASEKSGARGIRHIIEDLVENRLSELILLSQILPGEKALAVVEDGEVLIKVPERTH
jgi:ATP-dependent Clp protease ATP-binding subunit ClpC